MNRSEIVDLLLELYPLKSRKDVDTLVRLIFEFLKDKISEDSRIEIRGFGCFSIKQRLATSKTSTIGESSTFKRNVVYFRPGKYLRSRVDGGVDIS